MVAAQHFSWTWTWSWSWSSSSVDVDLDVDGLLLLPLARLLGLLVPLLLFHLPDERHLPIQHAPRPARLALFPEQHAVLVDLVSATPARHRETMYAIVGFGVR